MKRFAYVCADPAIPVPGRKGASIQITCAVRALSRRGLQGSVHALRPTRDRIGGIPVRTLGPSDRVQATYSRTSAARALDGLATNRSLDLTSERPDFIYERYSLWHYGALIEGRRLDIPYILEVNSPLPSEACERSLDPPRAASGVAEVLLKNADGIVCVSRGVADWAQSLGAAEDRLWIIPYGVDPELFAPNPNARRQAGLEWHDDDPVLLYRGSFRPWHGLDDLMTVFERLRRDHRELRLLLIGDGPERERIARVGAERGFVNHVHFTGEVAPEDVGRWSAAADIALAPYPNVEPLDSSPLELFEYMALGLPIVATRAGQIDEWVPDDERGLLCEPGDLGSLVAATSRLIRSKDDRRRLGAAGREWIEHTATWDHRVSAILDRVASLV